MRVRVGVMRNMRSFVFSHHVYVNECSLQYGGCGGRAEAVVSLMGWLCDVELWF
jgi:hypothetical protein